MSTSDFYISFGSNAAELASQLKTGLAPARREIKLFQGELANIGKGTKLGGLLAQEAGTTDRPAAKSRATAANATVDKSVRDTSSAVSAMARDTAKIVHGAAAAQAALDAVVSKIAHVATLLGSGATGRRAKETATNVSDPTDALATRTAQVAKSRASATNTSQSSRSTAQNTPKVLIDQAAFSRVVAAIEQDVAATHGVTSAVERLGVHLQNHLNSLATPKGTLAALGAVEPDAHAASGKPKSTPVETPKPISLAEVENRSSKGGTALTRILAELRAIHETIKLRRSRTSGSKTQPTDVSSSAEAQTNAKIRGAGNKPANLGVTYSTQSGRNEALSHVSADIKAQLPSLKELGQATLLVTRGYLSLTQAVTLFRAEAKAAGETKAPFKGKELRDAVTDARLIASTNVGAARDAKRVADDAAIQKHIADQQAKKDARAGDQKAQGNLKSAQAADTQDTVLKRLTASTQAEVVELARLKTAGASDVQITEQRRKAYFALNAELEKAGHKTAQRHQQIASLFTGAGVKTSATDLRGIAASAPAIPNAAAAAANSLKAAQAADSLKIAMDRLTTAAKAEIAELARLKTAGASDIQIVEQRRNAYFALNAELEKAGHKTAAQRNGQIATLFTGAGVPTSSADLRGIAAADPAKTGKQSGNTLGENMGQATGSAFSQALFGSRGFISRAVASSGTFVIRNFSAGLVFGLTGALKEAIEHAVETESTFVRVSEALKDTGRSSNGLRTALQGLSQQYGVSLKDVYTTAAGLTGLFDSSDVGNKQLIALTRVAVQLHIISGGALNATEAMRALSSITSAYGSQASDTLHISATHIADVLTVIQNKLGVNLTDSIEGVARLSGEAVEMGISFEHAATYVAAISKFTAQGGTGAGEQFSRILAAFRESKKQGVVTKALASIPGQKIDVGSLFSTGDYQGVIDTLLANFSKLGKAEQSAVTHALGGQKNAASINALLIEGPKILQTIGAAENNVGAAAQRAGEISKQLINQVARLRTGFVNFFVAIERSGALDSLGLIFGSLIFIIGQVNNQISAFNDLIDLIPGGGAVEHLLLAIGGLALGFSVARRAYLALRATLAVPATLSIIAANTAATAAATAPAAAASSTTAATAESAGLFALLSRGRRKPAEFDAARAARFVPKASQLDTLVVQRAAAADAARFGVGATAAADAGVLAATSRLGRVDPVTGLPVGRLQKLYGGTATKLTNLSTTLSDRSAVSSIAIAERGASTATGTVAAREALGTGAIIAANRASRLAAGGIGKLGEAMERMSRSAGLTTVGLLGIAAGLFIFYQGLQQSANVGDARKPAYNEAFGKPQDPNKPGSTAPTLYDTAQTTVRDSNKGWSGFTKDVSEAPSTIAYALGGGIFGYGRKPSDTANRNAGVTSAADDEKFTKAIFRNFGRFEEFGSKGDPHRGGKKTALTTKNVKAAIDASNKDLNDYAASIEKSGMSEEQKTSMEAALDNLKTQVTTTGQGYALMAAAGHQIDYLTQDQFDGVGAMLGSLASLSPAITKQFGGLLQDYITELNFNKTKGADSSKLAGYVQQLAVGTTTKFDPLTQKNATVALTPIQKGDIQVKAIQEALRVGQILIHAETDPTKKTAEITAATALMQTLDQTVASQMQAKISAAQGFADNLRSRGDFAGAAAAVKGILAQLAAQKDKLGPEAYQQQVNQALDAAAQDKASAASKSFEDAKLHTFNATTLATLEYQSAVASLKELERARGTVDQIRAARKQVEAIANALAREELIAAQVAAEVTLPTVFTGGGVGARAQYIEALKGKKKAAVGALNALLDPVGTYQDRQAAKTREHAAEGGKLTAASSYRQAVGQTTLSALAPGDTQAAAHQQYANALQAETDAAAQFGRNSTEYQSAVQAANGALHAIADADAANAEATTSLSLAYAQAAGKTIDVARLGQALAAQKLAYALQHSGGANTAEVQNARAASVAADRTYSDAIQATAEAHQNFGIAIATAHGQSIRVARLTLSAAKEKLAHALQVSGGARTDDVVNASAAVVAQNKALNDAIQTSVEAKANLGIALANASGNVVIAAQRAYALAREQLRNAQKHSGGKATGEVINARATEAGARASLRDAKLQDATDTVDFNLTMGRISANSAIHSLQEMLKAKNLTKAERRSLLEKIKGLQDNVRSSLTSSGFNISGVKLPTPYEIRRSLGVDKLVKSVNGTVAGSLKAMKGATASNPLGSASGSKDVVNALNDVKLAVVAKGAQNIKVDQSNQFHVPTAAVAKQIANQVIKLINEQSSRQGRASTSTPRLVGMG